MKAAQVVCSHDPDKAHARTMIAEIRDRLKRVARPDLRLEPQHLDPRMAARKGARSGDTLLERGEATRVLERIAGRHQPPDAVKGKPLHCDQTSAEVGVMRRIEGAAEQSNSHPRAVRGQADIAAGTAMPFHRPR